MSRKNTKNTLYTSQRELLLASSRLTLKPDEKFCNYYNTVIIKNYTLLKILYNQELALISDICKISPKHIYTLKILKI